MLIIIFIFIFGLLIGSFLNVVIYRLRAGGSVIKGRSYCPQCKKTLHFFDLLPLFSFFIQRGHCRYCQQKISWQYPLVELTTALLFLIVYHKFLLSYTLPYDKLLITNYQLLFTNLILIIGYWVFTCFLIIIFAYDFKHYLIADKVVIPGAILAFLFSFINPEVDWWASLIGATLISGFFALLIFITKGKGMGWGDVKLGLLVGALLGWQVSLLALLIAFVSGSLVGIILIIAKKKRWHSPVPFGTFLTVSAFICMLWGEKIIRWYLEMWQLY